MNKDTVKEILYIFIAILVSVVVVRVAIWLLPIILVAVLAYYIYTKLIKNKKNNKDNDERVIDVKYKEKGE